MGLNCYCILFSNSGSVRFGKLKRKIWSHKWNDILIAEQFQCNKNRNVHPKLKVGKRNKLSRQCCFFVHSEVESRFTRGFTINWQFLEIAILLKISQHDINFDLLFLRTENWKKNPLPDVDEHTYAKILPAADAKKKKRGKKTEPELIQTIIG